MLEQGKEQKPWGLAVMTFGSRCLLAVKVQRACCHLSKVIALQLSHLDVLRSLLRSVILSFSEMLLALTYLSVKDLLRLRTG